MKRHQSLCVSLLSLASFLGLGAKVQAQYVDPWINPVPIYGGDRNPIIPVVPDSRSSSPQTFPKILTICNKSKQRQVNVAYAYHNGQKWVKEGWRNILRGQCSTLSSNVMSQYVYYYAEGSQGGRWTGDKALCIHPTQTFSIGERPMKDCTTPYILRPFVVVDTGTSPQYRITLTD
ncbi:DUF1036 domain-containing protein [Nostoc sp. TCL26-01]|uniref:DUF1036 domain-containing protein n=1 Tax=Nostoc sp. TCL26-01 TaxID=2576904 RepID=UPI0015B97E1E|nr:DUF1036 domain-containing protein [Nostoc sp. TCL26-01]QLE55174.1 DUF1036 domain-containing protein [Nostoc sp. TCL26-01]